MFVVIDIDGTCSNAINRQHLVDGSQKKDWERFYDLCDEDAHHEDIRYIVWSLIGQLHTPIYMTGRVERVRVKTIGWLHHKGFPKGQVVMRPDGDTRQDCIVKAEMAEQAGVFPANTLCVLDDRDQVVKMWRERGFRCLQVAEWKF